MAYGGSKRNTRSWKNLFIQLRSHFSRQSISLWADTLRGILNCSMGFRFFPEILAAGVSGKKGWLLEKIASTSNQRLTPSYCRSVHQLPGRFEQWTHRSHYRGKTQDAHWPNKGLVSSTSEHQAGPVSQTRCMVDMAARRMDNAGICHTPTRLTPRQSKHATQQKQMKQSNWFTMLLKPSTSTRAKLKQSERFQPC